MHKHIDDLPAAREALGGMVRAENWGGMSCAVVQTSAGTDFCPFLAGLKNDHCQCPHWGYVFEGRMRVSYEDGTVEHFGAGDVFYCAPGHTVYIEEDAKHVEFSPAQEMDEVLDHIARRAAEL